MTTTPQSGPDSQPPSPKRVTGNRLVLATLALGGAGLVLSWIPVITVLGRVLALFALIVGLVALFFPNRKLTGAGMGLGVVALIVSGTLYPSPGPAVDQATEADQNPSGSSRVSTSPSETFSTSSTSTGPSTPTPAPISTAPSESPPPHTAKPTRSAKAGPAHAAGSEATVTKVTDGDTIHVRLASGEADTIRIIGIDTPETKDPRKPVQCWGPEASAFARDKLAGKTVTLQADPSQDNRGRYDRLIRYVVVDGQDYSIAAARAGMGRAYVYDEPGSKADEIAAAEAEARAADRGLWGPPCNGTTDSTTQPSTSSTPPPAPEPAPQPNGPAGNCVAGYSPCIPQGPDLDCGDLSGPITVTGSDPFRLDGDGDGIACE